MWFHLSRTCFGCFSWRRSSIIRLSFADTVSEEAPSEFLDCAQRILDQQHRYLCGCDDRHTCSLDEQCWVEEWSPFSFVYFLEFGPTLWNYSHLLGWSFLSLLCIHLRLAKFAPSSFLESTGIAHNLSRRCSLHQTGHLPASYLSPLLLADTVMDSS